MTARTGTCEYCAKRTHAHGLCDTHYARLRSGKSLDAPILRTRVERFWAKVDKRGPNECWLWTGASSYHHPSGRYGIFGNQSAQRSAYELLVGAIPDGLEIDHLCRVTLCVNPAHLEAVTHLENMRRAIMTRSLRTHCKHGHRYDEENTYWVPSKNGGRPHRLCRICSRAKGRRARERARSTRKAAA